MKLTRSLILTSLAACGNLAGSGSGSGPISGEFDTTFDVGTGFHGSVEALDVDDDDKILAVGTFDEFNGTAVPYVARLKTTGKLDTTFHQKLGTGPDDSVYAVAQSSSGLIYLGGAFESVSGRSYRYVVRLESDGTVDTDWLSGAGILGFDNDVGALTIDDDGNLLAGGRFSQFRGTTSNDLARVSPDGILDTTFATNMGTGVDLGVNVIHVDHLGRILVGGSFTNFKGNSRGRIFRLNTNGTEDTAFATKMGTGFNSGILAVAEDSDGGYIIGGDFSAFAGVSALPLVRLTSDGTLDTSFATRLGTGPTGGLAAVHAIWIDTFGDIYVAGDFTAFDGVACNGLARVSDLGIPDADFNLGLSTGFDDTVFALVGLSTGRLIAGGAFSTFNNTASRRIARIK